MSVGHGSGAGTSEKRSTVKRSVFPSLVVSTLALFTILVTPAVSGAQTFPLTNPCPPAATGGTCQPAGITTGPDGNIWFTEENGNRIGRITPGGAITEFPIPNPPSLPVEITPGPGGALWFTESAANSIRYITTAGAFGPRFPVGASPDGIVMGPDGNIWFTEPVANRIGKMTPGGADTHFSSSLNEPGDITVGPDNRLWFTQGAGGRIGAIPTSATPSSPSISHFGAGLGDPSGITSSAGALWFTEHGASQVRRIDTAGNIGPPTPVGAGPSAIATGADGALWFTEEIAGRIGRVTPSGVLTNEFPASSPGAEPGGITAGPDGALWFTEHVGNAIGRLATAPPFVSPPPPPPAPPATTKKAKRCKVPKLRGLTIKKARARLRKARCKYRFRGKGRVRSTVPKTGRTTTKRVTVKLKRAARR